MTAMSRLAWLDCLRLLAGVSMLILHCTADANGGAWVDYDVADRIAPLLIRTLAYAARTELFIIISLFLLMMSLEKRPRGYRETIAEQAQRLLVPFAFWTVFYAFFSLIKAEHFGYLDAKLAALGDIRTWVSFALLGTSKYHMHFLPTLFCVVLAYPLMRKAVEVPALGGLVVMQYGRIIDQGPAELVRDRISTGWSRFIGARQLDTEDNLTRWIHSHFRRGPEEANKRRVTMVATDMLTYSCKSADPGWPGLITFSFKHFEGHCILRMEDQDDPISSAQFERARQAAKEGSMSKDILPLASIFQNSLEVEKSSHMDNRVLEVKVKTFDPRRVKAGAKDGAQSKS